MLYIIEDIQKAMTITETDFESGMDKKGYYKQLYDKDGIPLILNDRNCEEGKQEIIFEIYRRGIDMNRHRLFAFNLDARNCKYFNKCIRQKLKELREYEKKLKEID